jgi:hypothetical protein
MSERISSGRFRSGISSIIFLTRESIRILYTDVDAIVTCIHLLYINYTAREPDFNSRVVLMGVASSKKNAGSTRNRGKIIQGEKVIVVS